MIRIAGWVEPAKPNASHVKTTNETHARNHRHETAAAIAPGAVTLGFAGSTRPAGLVFLPRPFAGETDAAPAQPTCTPEPGRQKKVVIPAKAGIHRALFKCWAEEKPLDSRLRGNDGWRAIPSPGATRHPLPQAGEGQETFPRLRRGRSKTRAAPMKCSKTEAARACCVTISECFISEIIAHQAQSAIEYVACVERRPHKEKSRFPEGKRDKSHLSVRPGARTSQIGRRITVTATPRQRRAAPAASSAAGSQTRRQPAAAPAGQGRTRPAWAPPPPPFPRTGARRPGLSCTCGRAGR